MQLRGATHCAPTAVSSTNVTVAAATTSWLRRFVDDDEHCSSFLCPAPSVGTTYSAVRATCPF